MKENIKRKKADLSNMETLFKFLHIIKGSSRQFSFTFISKKTHEIETILARIHELTDNIDLNDNEKFKNISMQVAAMNPIALNEENVSKEVIEKEIEIAKEQLRAEGKPEAMLDNIAKGKLKKFFKDNTLINQSYIKDNKLSIQNYIESEDKDCTITSFKRVALV